MFGLTPLGIVHTAFSLVAIVCGFWSLARFHEISPRQRLGQIYLVATLVAAGTALGIFRHGGFGPAHGLALLTLAALVVGTWAALTTAFGRAARYVQATCYSATILFHMIPGVTETLTRFPAGAPVLPSAEAPAFQPIYGALLLLFLFGLALQIRWLQAQPQPQRG